jgi:hypothetical protein
MASWRERSGPAGRTTSVSSRGLTGGFSDSIGNCSTETVGGSSTAGGGAASVRENGKTSADGRTNTVVSSAAPGLPSISGGGGT